MALMLDQTVTGPRPQVPPPSTEPQAYVEGKGWVPISQAPQPGPAPTPAIPVTPATPSVPEPMDILSGHLDSLQQTFRQKEQQLRSLTEGPNRITPAQYASQIQRLQADYDQQKAQITQTQGTFSVLQSAIESGRIDPDTGRKAMYSLVLPKEAVYALYPKAEAASAEPTRRPFSPTALLDYADTAAEFAQAVDRRSFFSPASAEIVPQTDLLKQYTAWRTQSGYDSLTANEQRQLDAEWDAVMRGDPRRQWDTSDPQIKALRTYGDPVLRAAATRVSPLARELAAEQKRQQPPAPKQAASKASAREEYARRRRAGMSQQEAAAGLDLR